MNPDQLTRDFRASEFACRHCGALGVQYRLVELLQGLRDRLGPIRITSGYRCPKHRLERIKAKPGRHTEGIAADITGPPQAMIWAALKDFPEFAGVGIAPHQRFVHLDIRSGVPRGGRVVWAYDRQGRQVRWSGIWNELPK
jgi:uncharacterized protein YcbK (DUF882 family)